MKAIEFGTDQVARVVDRDIPRIGEGEALVRIASAGICGSDLTALRGTHPFRIPPLISGHEGGGTVVAVGDHDHDDWLGATVAIEPQRSCGTCDPCSLGLQHLCLNKVMLGVAEWPGSFAEYVSVPVKCLYRVAAHVPREFAALAEPLAVSHHSVQQAAPVRGRRVAVLGGGTIGALIVYFLHEEGAGPIVVTDPRPHNREVCLDLGASTAIDPKGDGWKDAVVAAVGGALDIVLVATTPPEIVDDAVSLLRPRGTVVQVGLFGHEISFDIAALQLNEKRLVGSNVYTPEDFRGAVAALEKDGEKISSVVNGRVSLWEATEYLASKIRGDIDDVIKMMVFPPDHEGRTGAAIEDPGKDAP